MPDYNFLILLLPLFIALATFGHCDGKDCKVDPSLLNLTIYNCPNGKSFCYPNVLSYTEFDGTDAPIQRKPSRRFRKIADAKPLESAEAWCKSVEPEAAGHFQKEYLDGPIAYLDDHLPMFVNLVAKLWGQAAECGKSQIVTTDASTSSKSIGTSATTASTSVGTKSTSSPTTMPSTTKSTGKTTTESTSKATTKESNVQCVAEWEYVKAAKFLDGYAFEFNVNGLSDIRVVHEWNFAVRVGFLRKPIETEGSHEFKRLKESVLKEALKSGDQVLKAEYIMQMVENSTVRDLKKEDFYDYLDIPVDQREKNAAELVVEVCVHNCSDGTIFVSAARKMNDTKKGKPTPWRNWSKDLAFLNYCCYLPDTIGNKTFDAEEIKEIVKHGYCPEHIDANIELKFGYELPNKKTLTREQQLATSYKYGLSLAKRPRFRNKNSFAADALHPFTDGWFIAPPKLTVELAKEHKVNIKFHYYEGMKWDNQKEKLVEIRQWTIPCDCTNESQVPDGEDGLMRDLKLFVPRIYGAIIVNETTHQRERHNIDVVNAVTVEARSKVYKDSLRDFILYEESEWKDDI